MFGRSGMRMTIRRPPTTHFVATVDDLTDMLDFNSEDIDGMDDDAGDEQESLPTGHWTATSSYHMVDTPKEGNGDGTAEDDPSKKQPKRRRQRRRSKSRQGKSGDTDIGDNSSRTLPKMTTIPSSKI